MSKRITITVSDETAARIEAEAVREHRPEANMVAALVEEGLAERRVRRERVSGGAQE